MRKNQVTDKLLSGTNVLRQLMFLTLMALCTSSAFAQKQVSGTGTSTGTVTDFDGNFTLKSVPENGSLVISYVGYRNQTVPVAGKN